MKKLLGVIGILALAAAMLPAHGYADLRGGFAPLTTASGFSVGCEHSAHRPDDGSQTMLIPYGLAGAGQNDPRVDCLWFSFSTRSLVPGHENVRSIYLHANLQQSGYFAVLKKDPDVGVGGHVDVSYYDPAWSFDGKYLAYIKQIGLVSGIYVQQYFVSDDFEAVYGPGAGADSPVGDEWLVTDIGNPRHPSWSPSGYKLVFDNDLGGTRDLYTADVDVVGHAQSVPTLITFDNVKAEENPSWGGVNGDEIVYTTNKYGPLVLEIVNLASAPTPADPRVRLAELGFSFITHNNPDWTPDGKSLYYDAAASENPNNGSAIWKLDLDTQVKCEVQLDNRADADPDVSPVTQTVAGTPPYEYQNFMFTTQAGNLGLAIWRGNTVNSCLTPLPMIVSITPTNVNYKSKNPTPFVTVMRFTDEATALRYQARSSDDRYPIRRITGAGTCCPETTYTQADSPGFIQGVPGVSQGPRYEGVRMRSTLFMSPTLAGVECPTNPDLNNGLFGVSNTECFNTQDTLSLSPFSRQFTITCYYDRRTIIDQLVALGLTDRVVPMEMTAYTNFTGRAFHGTAYIKVTKSSTGAASSVNLISNAPNPFNPVTQIKFSVAQAGKYTLRIYDVRGALVKTLASQRYDVGTHEATWDGRTTAGGKAASGVYYAKISGDGDAGSTLRLVMAK